MRKTAKTILILVTFLLLMGCNPIAAVGKNAVKENKKNVDWLAKELTGYYDKDKKLKKDTKEDLLLGVTGAQSLATKMLEKFE